MNSIDDTMRGTKGFGSTGRGNPLDSQVLVQPMETDGEQMVNGKLFAFMRGRTRAGLLPAPSAYQRTIVSLVFEIARWADVP